jgi:hypothetical protein
MSFMSGLSWPENFYSAIFKTKNFPKLPADAAQTAEFVLGQIPSLYGAVTKAVYSRTHTLDELAVGNNQPEPVIKSWVDAGLHHVRTSDALKEILSAGLSEMNMIASRRWFGEWSALVIDARNAMKRVYEFINANPGIYLDFDALRVSTMVRQEVDFEIDLTDRGLHEGNYLTVDLCDRLAAFGIKTVGALVNCSEQVLRSQGLKIEDINFINDELLTLGLALKRQR